MAEPTIKTTKEIVPVIYAYTTPEIVRHNGWTKIGDTFRGAEKRINEQTFTADVEWKLEWQANAIYEGTNEVFRDHDFHAYLQKLGIERGKGTNEKGQIVDNEWFHIMPLDAKYKLYDFRADRGIIKSLGAIPYSLRDEQLDAVQKTKQYFETHGGKSPEYLWNAKPRFGKTLTAYDLCKKLNAVNILIVTNRPAIANSWYSDYETFFGTESGYYFVSETDALKGKPGVYTREQLVSSGVFRKDDYKGCIIFVSLQDLKGSIYFGGHHKKLDYLYKGDRDTKPGLVFDVLIIDEAHEGVDTYKTDIAFNNIARKYTLHLSGTPFKALANDKFESDAIYNWTYADEQAAKRDWSDEDRSNPYQTLPRLNLLTYRMSDIVFDKVSAGADFDNDGDNEAYAFDLNEFFKVNESGTFIHDKDVDAFLDALTSQTKFPFSTLYRDELKHTLWILKYISSAKALYKKLKSHPVFKDYEIISAFGDGKIDDDENIDDTVIDSAVKKSYDKVVKAIEKYEKTITLSVGQLTTGITVPEWTAVMILSNMQSPALYMQAAFRAQNPCEFKAEGKVLRKENAYVFDFDPARTLDIFEQFANGLYSDTASGKGETDIRKARVRELLNFFPVYGEDDEGEMIELDAEKVLSIPRAIHAREVVRKGFMCNFLFQNIAGIFSAPSVVTGIINKFEPVKEPADVNKNTRDDLNINDNGEIDVPQSTIIGTASNIFGKKLYSDIESELQSAVDKAKETSDNSNKKDDTLEKLKESLHVSMTDELTGKAKEKYGNEMSKSTQAGVAREINRNADKEVEKHYGEFSIQKTLIEDERKKEVEQAESEGRHEDVAKINADAERKHAENNQHFEQNIMTAIHNIIEDAGNTIVRAVETDKKEREKKTIEDKVRDHLRGFSRTIPSFLMAYGNDETTLENFDTIVPDDVFCEVTRNITTHECVTLDDFRFLRDGGDRLNEETGEIEHFEGQLFDPVVFNDSIKEFMRLRSKLADYFDESQEEDIFNYIPPQKTNQIFTPRWVVQKMVDELEENNPGCFDDPEKTFADLYMKSGLYITEIIKRLYRSEKMKELFPYDHDRIQHIIRKQVYGIAPTQIIYLIATNYILGFDEALKSETSHFAMYDTAEAAKNGTLQQVVDKLFEGK